MKLRTSLPFPGLPIEQSLSNDGYGGPRRDLFLPVAGVEQISPREQGRQHRMSCQQSEGGRGLRWREAEARDGK